MSELKENLIPEAALQNVKELATALLQEDFAIQNGLEKLCLLEVEKKLASALEGIEAVNLTPAQESAQKAWGYLCLILQDLELNNVEEIPKLLLREMAGVPAVPERIYKSALSKEYSTLSQFLGRCYETELPVSKPVAHKILAQLSCFAFESELNDRLRTAIHKFWPERHELSRVLLVARSGQLHLHPKLVIWVQEVQDRFPELSSAGTAHDTIFVNTLRYLVQTERPEDFKPTLAEGAVLLLFFSQKLDLLGSKIANPLCAIGTSEEERLELSLRLMRLQKVKLKSLSVQGDFDESLWEMFQSDEKATWMILERLEFEKRDPLEQVA